MSPEQLSEMEQLDALANELHDAGRLARVAIDHRARPESAFAGKLRSDLFAAYGQEETPVAASESRVRNALAPVANLMERRGHARPFGYRPSVDVNAEPEILRPEPQPQVRETRAGRRWSGLGQGSRPSSRPSLDDLLVEGAHSESGHVGRLHPSLTWRLPVGMAPARLAVAGMAACLGLALVIGGSGLIWPSRPADLAAEADGTSVVRNGSASELAAGDRLQEGDEIRVGSGGHAVLTLGSSVVRVAEGGDLRLNSLDSSNLVLAQLAGRAYHRVSVPSGGSYTVVTASVSWRATGTAFDVDRYSSSSGGEMVRTLALQHSVDLSGPEITARVAEGDSATVVLRPDGSPNGQPVFAPIGADTLADTWLLENARADAQMGLPLGLLAVALSPAPQPVATQTPTASPTATPTPEPAAATPAPTPVPEPVTPRPTYPVVNLGPLYAHDNGDGTYSFSWTKYTGSWNSETYYKLVYGPWGSNPSFDGGNYWACNGSSWQNTASVCVTPGDWAVRIQVVDESSGKIVIKGQTSVAHVTLGLPPTVDLGPLSVTNLGGGQYRFTWAAYNGCPPFSYYKLMATTDGSDPDYPSGNGSYLAVPDTGATSATIPLGPGEYWIRIQAIGYPNGAYAYAQTSILHLTVPPPATPTPTPTPTATPTPTPT